MVYFLGLFVVVQIFEPQGKLLIPREQLDSPSMFFDVLVKESTVGGRFLGEMIRQLIRENALQLLDGNEIQYRPYH